MNKKSFEYWLEEPFNEFIDYLKRTNFNESTTIKDLVVVYNSHPRNRKTTFKFLILNKNRDQELIELGRDKYNHLIYSGKDEYEISGQSLISALNYMKSQIFEKIKTNMNNMGLADGDNIIYNLEFRNRGYFY